MPRVDITMIPGRDDQTLGGHNWDFGVSKLLKCSTGYHLIRSRWESEVEMFNR